MGLPLATASEPAAGARFDQRFDRLCRRYESLWWNTSSGPPDLGPPPGRWRQWRTARATRRLIDELAGEVERYPDEAGERRAWRKRLKARLQAFGEQRFGWPRGYRDLLFGDEFFDATVEFARQARAFDPSIRPEHVMQALRNVWIMNSLQMLLDRPVAFTPSIFAYSMLYPLTDNLLDDPAVEPAVKTELNGRLGRRLAGERLPPSDLRQRRVWEMIERIEGEFPRRRFPEVWHSLLAIHRGQVASLRQQRSAAVPGPAELLRLSIAKGGASVLADGYLVAGELADDEADFSFGYGVFLQLLDDLQDVRADREAGHATLFSTARPPLDRLAGRLDRFMRRVVNGSPRFAGPAFAGRRDLILRNCRALLVGAMAEEPALFSRVFRRRVGRFWPVSLRAVRRLRRLADRRQHRTVERLRRRRGVDSLFELLDQR